MAIRGLNRMPGAIWCLRRPSAAEKPWNTCVRTGEMDTVEVIFDPDVLHARPRTNVMRMSRADARLLARRLNQCLDATVKK